LSFSNWESCGLVVSWHNSIHGNSIIGVFSSKSKGFFSNVKEVNLVGVSGGERVFGSDFSGGSSESAPGVSSEWKFGRIVIFIDDSIPQGMEFINIIVIS